MIPLLNLVPSNIAADLAADNIVAIIIIAVAVAVAYVSISSEEGEDKVLVIKKLIEAVKKVIFNILAYVIDLTPYAVLCLTACSASQLLSDKEALVQLVLLVVMVFAACLIQSYVVNAVILKSFAKVNPLKFFKKTFDAQATAFTTTSSVGTMPITIDRLIRKVGVDEEVANFTAPLGTTIGMAGCTCVWPILLAMFYLNATGTELGSKPVPCYDALCVWYFPLERRNAGSWSYHSSISVQRSESADRSSCTFDSDQQHYRHGTYSYKCYRCQRMCSSCSSVRTDF